MAMKKVSKSSKTTKRTVKKSIPKTQAIVVHRIIVISACVALVVIAGIAANRHTMHQAVAGASVMRGLFMQTTVSLPKVSDAVSYNVYYRQFGDNTYTNAARSIPASESTYTVSYLKKGTQYEYRVAAVDKNGKEFFFSEPQPVVNLQSM